MMKQYMKSVMTMALMLLFTSGAWAADVNIKKQLNGVDNDAAGTVTSSISEGVCTLTVTPASGNYVTKDFITASSSVTGNMAQTPRRDPGLDVSTITVTASDASADPSGETKYTLTMPADGSNVDVTVNFQSRKALTLTMVEDIPDETFNWVGHEPELIIKDGNDDLVKGTHYTVVYSDTVNAGTAKVTITGKGLYTTNSGEATSIVKTFTINPKNLSEDNIVGNLIDVKDSNGNDILKYEGEAHKPTLDGISYNDHDLEYSVDYWTAYPDSVNAGTGMEDGDGVAKGPRCEIIGKGNFTGKVIRYYTIKQADFNVEIADIPEQTATGEPIEPELTVTFKNTNNKTITVDASDYRAEYSNNVNPGTATVILSSTGNNFKTELTQTKTFIINAIKDYLSIKDGEAFLSKLRVTNGNTFDVKAHYQVVCPEDIPAANLTWESADETVVSVNNNGVITAEGYGNVKITLTCAGGGKYEEDTYDFYVDAAPKTPTISLPAGAYPSDQGAITMTKENVTGMAISYTWDDITGDNDATWTDYTEDGVVFREGTLSARVGYTPAAGGTTIYSDTVSVVYTIVDPKEITADMVTLEKDAYDYTGSAIIPDVKVYDSEKGAYLVKDTDFELSCENNTNVGTATVTVTGKVNYKGSVEKTFEIIYRASGEQFDAAIGDNTYGTFFDNTNDTYLPDGYSAYFITGVSGTTATTQSLTYIPKGTAVIVAKVASTGATAPGAGNMMIHVDADTDVATMAGTIYGLYNGKLMKVTMGTIAAGKNVLQVAGGSGAPELSISIGDENTTAINEHESHELNELSGEWFSIDGVKLNGQPQKPGLYIKNGKKVVVINK